MRIAYVGNFERSFSTETHIAKTLEDMGHEVTRIQEQKHGQMPPEQAHGHDLFLWTRTWAGFVTNAVLEALRASNITSVSVHLDLYIGLDRESSLQGDPFWRTDYVFTADGDPVSQAKFEKLGINHHWLPPAVFKPECIPGTPQPKYTANVGFIGNMYYHREWPYRHQLIQKLKGMYDKDFKLFGTINYPSVRDQELNDCLASIKVMVGDSLCIGYTHQNYWSDRLYETIGRGGFIIFPKIQGLETQFDMSHELITYDFGDFDQLRRLIDYFVTHDEEREIFRQRAYKRVLKDHTYHNRMGALLETIQ